MSLLRFGGKDPQGNAKGINTDTKGNIVTGINSSIDIINNVNIAGGGSVTSDEFKVQGSHILFSCQFGLTPSRVIDIHWLDNEGNELSVDYEVVKGVNFVSKNVFVKSANAKITVHNTHTSARDVSVSAGIFVGRSAKHDLISMDAVLPKTPITAGASKTTEMIFCTNSPASIVFHASAGGWKSVDAEWYDQEGVLLSIDRNIARSVLDFENKKIHLKSPYFKLVVHNNHTSDRDIGLYLSEYNLSSSEQQSRIRLLGSGAVTVAGNCSKRIHDDVFNTNGDPAEVGFDIDIGQFPILIYFGARTTQHTDGWSLSMNFRGMPPAIQGVGGVSQLTSTQTVIPSPPESSTDEIYGVSEWLEVKGNGIRANINNNDTEERTYQVAVWGIF